MTFAPSGTPQSIMYGDLLSVSYMILVMRKKWSRSKPFLPRQIVFGSNKQSRGGGRFLGGNTFRMTVP